MRIPCQTLFLGSQLGGERRLLELRLDLCGEQLQPAFRFVEGHVAGRELEQDVVDAAGLEDGGEALGDLPGGAGAESDRVLDVGQDPVQGREWTRGQTLEAGRLPGSWRKGVPHRARCGSGTELSLNCPLVNRYGGGPGQKRCARSCRSGEAPSVVLERTVVVRPVSGLCWLPNDAPVSSPTSMTLPAAGLSQKPRP